MFCINHLKKNLVHIKLVKTTKKDFFYEAHISLAVYPCTNNKDVGNVNHSLEFIKIFF